MPADLGLQDGDHACILYASEREHEAVIGTFLAEGLRTGQRVMNIVHDHTLDHMRGMLSQKGLDARACEQRGQLTIKEALPAYTPDGRFDPDEMVAGLMGIVERAVADGWDGMRGTGEMSWALEGRPGSERIMEYEAKLNSAIPGSRFRAICQYDVRRFPPEVLLEVLTTHPVAFIGTKRLDNFYYMPPEEYLSDRRGHAQLDRWLLNLEQRQTREEEARERIRQQEALRRSQRDVEARTRFLNQAAHELATPLTPIGLQLRVLATADPRRPLADYQRNLETLQRSYGRFEALMHRLLEAVQGGLAGPAIDDGVQLRLLVEDAVQAHRTDAAAKGVGLRFECPVGATVRADPVAARKALDAYLSNAVKFTPPGGAVEVAAELDGPCWAVRVRDSGIGFDPALAPRAFDAFAQLQDPAAVQEAGVGLGLHIARQAIETQGGRVWASSQGPGQGSEFGFALPAGHPPVRQPPGPSAPA